MGTIRAKCPGCTNDLDVPGYRAGAKTMCPTCGTVVDVPSPDQPPAGLGVWPPPGEPAPSEPPVAWREDSSPPELTPVPEPKQYDGFFGPEKRGIDKGIVGGIIMMVIAAIWFLAGWAVGIIFFYPPILFLIGLFALLKGLFTGNIAGERQEASSYT